jgi:hypothetical protein
MTPALVVFLATLAAQPVSPSHIRGIVVDVTGIVNEGSHSPETKRAAAPMALLPTTGVAHETNPQEPVLRD